MRKGQEVKRAIFQGRGNQNVQREETASAHVRREERAHGQQASPHPEGCYRTLMIWGFRQ